MCMKNFHFPVKTLKSHFVANKKRQEKPDFDMLFNVGLIN